MDTSQDINTVEWFFGYGGNHLGLKRVLPNLRLLAACEIEEFAIENILAKMEAGHLEAAPIWSDCKTFPWEPFVDRTHLFVASYPCQPFSAAGKRQGADDERHLWPYVHRWILRARPLLVFLENVEGHISLGLSTVISDLEEGGYKTTWGVFSAAEVGAPHQRKRVFIMAHKLGAGLEGFRADPCQDSQGRQEQDGYARSGCLRDRELDNADTMAAGGIAGVLGSAQGEEQGERLQRQRPRHPAGYAGKNTWPSRPGELQYEWEPPRVVNATGSRRNGSEQGSETATREQARVSLFSARHGSVGNANSPGLQERQGQRGPRIQRTDADGGETAERQAESPLGGNIDGPSGGLGYADLCESCANRTDELRLLGNGVVPATAERAFRVLFSELTAHNTQQPHT